MIGKEHDSDDAKSGDLPILKMRLFIAGNEPNSKQAIEFLARFCEKYLPDRYEYDIIDVLENYQAALDNKIIAVPALLIEAPPPKRIIIGSLQDEERLLKITGILSGEN